MRFRASRRAFRTSRETVAAGVALGLHADLALRRHDHFDGSFVIAKANNFGEYRVERLAFLLKFDELDKARTSIRESAAASAQNWPDHLLAFVIDHKVDPAASKRLDAWAAGMGSSSAWLLAAHAYGLVGHNEALERSAKRAQITPLDEPAWLHYNTRFRGTVVVLQLLKTGQYETCAALCDALLARHDTYLQPELTTLRDLARHAHPGNPAPSPPTIDEGKLFTPFKGIDLARLIVAPGVATAARTLPVDPQTRMIHYLDQKIAADPRSWRKWDEKFCYLRAVNRYDEALTAYKSAAQALPDWWKPRLALAMLGPQASRAQGRAAFAAWVQEHPGFIHWCYLSRLYREAGHNAEALDALRQAVKYPLESIDRGEGWVPQAFAFDAATFACRHRKHDLLLEITAVWAKPRGVYNHFDNNIYAFRAAAKLGKGQFAAAQADATSVLEAKGLWAQNLRALQRAIEAKDTSFQYDADPSDQFRDFAPFRD